jgi:hypothetical protein
MIAGRRPRAAAAGRPARAGRLERDDRRGRRPPASSAARCAVVASSATGARSGSGTRARPRVQGAKRDGHARRPEDPSSVWRCSGPGSARNADRRAVEARPPARRAHARRASGERTVYSPGRGRARARARRVLGPSRSRRGRGSGGADESSTVTAVPPSRATLALVPVANRQRQRGTVRSDGCSSADYRRRMRVVVGLALMRAPGSSLGRRRRPCEPLRRAQATPRSPHQRAGVEGDYLRALHERIHWRWARVFIDAVASARPPGDPLNNPALRTEIYLHVRWDGTPADLTLVKSSGQPASIGARSPPFGRPHQLSRAASVALRGRWRSRTSAGRSPATPALLGRRRPPASRTAGRGAAAPVPRGPHEGGAPARHAPMQRGIERHGRVRARVAGTARTDVASPTQGGGRARPGRATSARSSGCGRRSRTGHRRLAGACLAALRVDVCAMVDPALRARDPAASELAMTALRECGARRRRIVPRAARRARRRRGGAQAAARVGAEDPRGARPCRWQAPDPLLGDRSPELRAAAALAFAQPAAAARLTASRPAQGRERRRARRRPPAAVRSSGELSFEYTATALHEQDDRPLVADRPALGSCRPRRPPTCSRRSSSAAPRSRSRAARARPPHGRQGALIFKPLADEAKKNPRLQRAAHSSCTRPRPSTSSCRSPRIRCSGILAYKAMLRAGHHAEAADWIVARFETGPPILPSFAAWLAPPRGSPPRNVRGLNAAVAMRIAPDGWATQLARRPAGTGGRRGLGLAEQRVKAPGGPPINKRTS